MNRSPRIALALLASTASALTVAGVSAPAAHADTGILVARGNVFMRPAHSMANTPIEVVAKGHAVHRIGASVGIWTPVSDGAHRGWVATRWLTPVAAMPQQPNPVMTTTTTGGLIPLSAILSASDSSTPSLMLPYSWSNHVAQRMADVPAARSVSGPYGVTSNGTAIAAAIRQQFPQVSLMGGFRDDPGAEDHATGHAIDVMLPGNYSHDDQKALGAAIARWAQVNAPTLHVSYVIWHQHIWNPSRDAEGWRAMPDRGSDTANHFDHVHISFH